LPIVRVRQHVNPLSLKYQTPPTVPVWEQVYTNSAQPLHLDIGCARGQFLLAMAQQQPDWNFLGLEIRQPLVTQANQQRDELGLTNLHYIFCNVNNFLRPLLESLSAHRLHRVSIQFPDPWFKKRHQKRRVVQPEVVTLLTDFLAPNGVIFLQSDVESVAAEMCERFQEDDRLIRRPEGWLAQNPLAIATEREQSTLAKGEPVFRAVFYKR
jgi:tRNA (guanine-N7-)-methyltransferase